ncbi:MAG: hypothetical protein M3033_10885 [Acidobacteriota bacterium]|nr:hypothetical protein [Acidobacteriota bacterium]
MKTFIDYLSKFVFTITLIFFFYGIIRFPDGPIHRCDENSYCGKQGQHRTIEDFEAYNRWQTISLVSFPLMFILLFISERNKKDKLKHYFDKN